MSNAPLAAPPRRGARRLAAGLIAASLALILPAAAAAGEYTVVQCAAAHRGFEDAAFDRIHGADYGFGKHCDDATEANSLQVRSITSSQAGRAGRISWLAPAGTRLAGVDLQARLRRDAGHHARLLYLGAGGTTAGQLASGSDAPSSFEAFAGRPSGGRAGFAAELACEERAGCPQSDQARVWIRDVRFTLDDTVAPSVALSGPIFDPGWRRGRLDLTARLGDVGSGLRSAVTTVNGKPAGPAASWAGATTVPGGSTATRLQPCATAREIGGTVDTAAAPFADGANVVAVCGRDFGPAPEQGCAQRLVFVDNAEPQAAFAGPPPAEDPELIEATASDEHSGLAGTEIAYRPVGGGDWRELETTRAGSALSARVDSAAEPPGRYLFRLTATDVAGNATTTSRDSSGREMVLEFPLKSATTLGASIGGRPSVGYGERPRLSGLLRAARGPAASGETVIVSERFDPGSSPALLTHRVRTDAAGRFGLRLSAGPSRRVVVGYAGSRRLQPSASRPVRLRVGGQASLEVSARRVRAGRKVRFRGAVGRLGAAMPAAGKLVELQAREAGGGPFRTVRQAFRTDPRGRVRSAYRFGRFYTEPTVYRFRLEVTSESGWPYRGPAYSPVRRLKVLPRR